MDEFKTTADKRGPGRPKLSTEPGHTNAITGFRRVHHVQIHDSFQPLGMAPLMSISMEGHRPMAELCECERGIYVKTKPEKDARTGKLREREFVIPLGNISHYEYAED
jgi:hypothetical protein